jgi:uncharacterized protein (TIGR02266 family)
MKESIDSDRRRSDRVPVEMWVQESRERELYFQRAANLSRGGLFLENTIPHPFGTMVELEFTLPGESVPMRLRGRIVNIAGGTGDLGMGVEFVDLDPAVAYKIDSFIDREGRAA